MSLIPQHYCLKWNNHSSNFIDSFAELLKSESLTDVTLAVENGASIKCHKMVLAACSKYFEDLFMRNTAFNEHHPIIIISGVRVREMQAVLDYMYKGEVNVGQQELPELMKVATFLKVKGLSSESDVKQDNPEPSTPPPPPVQSTIPANAPSSTNGNGYISPSHLSSSAYVPYGKPPIERSPNELNLWAAAFPQLLVPQHPISSQQPISRSHLGLLPHPYEASPEASPLGRKKLASFMGSLDQTPILRNVLGQGQQAQAESYYQERQDSSYRSNSNGSANDVDRRNSSELSEPMPEEDEKPSTSHRQGNHRSGDPKEWKRYKQYSREDIDDAMQAVKKKRMSALQAASKFGIPSRTLYDKLKKAGIIAQRNSNRRSEAAHCASSGASSAQFPYSNGLNGSVYGEAAASSHGSPNEHDDEASMEVPPSTPSPSVAAAHGRLSAPQRSPSPGLINHHHHLAAGYVNGHAPHHLLHPQQQQQQQLLPQAHDDEIEDLSVNRRASSSASSSAGSSAGNNHSGGEVGVIVPTPSSAVAVSSQQHSGGEGADDRPAVDYTEATSPARI